MNYQLVKIITQDEEQTTIQNKARLNINRKQLSGVIPKTTAIW